MRTSPLTRVFIYWRRAPNKSEEARSYVQKDKIEEQRGILDFFHAAKRKSCGLAPATFFAPRDAPY